MLRFTRNIVCRRVINFKPSPIRIKVYHAPIIIHHRKFSEPPKQSFLKRLIADVKEKAKFEFQKRSRLEQICIVIVGIILHFLCIFYDFHIIMCFAFTIVLIYLGVRYFMDSLIKLLKNRDS